MGLRLVVDLKGATKFRRALQRTIQEQGPGRFTFLNRLGLTVLRWVDRNFSAQGGLAGGWAPLRPLTIFGRRGGAGGILGKLGLGFTYTATDQDVRVGTASKIAPYHQFGTKPYKIFPKKPGGALAFPAPPEFLSQKNPTTGKRRVGAFFRRRVKGPGLKAEARTGIATAQSVRAAGFKLPGGKGDIKSFAVVKFVNHPGLPARRMLPSQAEILPEVKKTAIDWLNEHFARTGLGVRQTQAED